MLGHLELDSVESLAVHAVDEPLGYESMFVDALDYAEYGHRLVATAHHQQHLHFVLAVPPHTVKHRAPAMGLRQHRIGYLLPVRRDDGKLHSLAVGVDNHIRQHRHYEQEHHAVDGGLDAVEYEIRRADDAHIDVNHHAPERHIALFRYDSSHDVRAARRAVVDIRQPHAEPCHDRPDKHVHEILPLDYRLMEKRLEETDAERQHRSPEYGTDDECLADLAPRYRKQERVDRIRRDSHRHSVTEVVLREEIDYRTETCHASDDDLFGQHERTKPERVHRQTQRDDDVVFGRQPKLVI